MESFVNVFVEDLNNQNLLVDLFGCPEVNIIRNYLKNGKSVFHEVKSGVILV